MSNERFLLNDLFRYTNNKERMSDEIILPLELIDQSIGNRIRAIMSDEHEFEGTLVGFDDFVNIVLDNVTEFLKSGEEIKRKKMLISSRHLVMLVPVEQ